MEQLEERQRKETSKPDCSDLWQHPSQIHMDSFFPQRNKTDVYLRQCFMQKAGLTHFLFPPHAQSLPSLSISCCPLNLCPVTRRQRFKKQQKQNILLSAGLNRGRMACTQRWYPASWANLIPYRYLTHLRVLTSHQRTKRSSPWGKGRLLPQKACYKFQIPVLSAFMCCFSNI